MVRDRTRRSFLWLAAAILAVGIPVISTLVTQALSAWESFGIVTVLLVVAISANFLNKLVQERSDEERPEAIKERVSELHSELRSQVQSRSYGARSKLIAAPLKELDLDITPRMGWVRDPRLTEPEPISEDTADVVAFTSSKRRLLIVGEPGSGKTTAAYALIEHLDEREGDERVPLLVNLSAWEAQDSVEAFLVDYLVSEVGYQVRERAVATTFISSDRYSLILDGLDEIPAKLRSHFSERLDEFVRGLPSEIGVVVTCRTHEYEELLAAHPTGLGLVQAVELLPLSSKQLDSALGELAKFDKDWQTFLTEPHFTASQWVRDLLSNPLFLNLAAAGRLRPGELLECADEQHLRDLVLERYLDRALAEKSKYEPQDVRRYLTWVAQFLNGARASPFGLKASDSTVFDLADLTPPAPPRRYWLLGGLVVGLALGLVWGPGFGLVLGLVWVLGLVLVFGMGWGLVWVLLARKYRLLEVLAWGLVFGLGLGLALGLALGLRNGGWFVLLQRVAHRRLARAGNLPPHPADFLEWGVERQIFRRVGGGVRFRHSLIQQHLAKTSAGALL